ncbi:MAG: chromosomal replication initiator protein DnaA [Phycisphaerales bacterium]
MTDPDRKIWEGMLSHLRATNPSICRQWFGDLEPLGVASGALVVRVHSPVHRDYLKSRCADAFNDAARTASGRLLAVRFISPGEESSDLPGRDGTGRDSSGRRSAAREIKAEPSRPAPRIEPPDATPADVPSNNGAESHQRNSAADTATNASQAPASDPPGERATSVVRRDALVINPDYAFENFVIGPENRLAHAAAVAVGDNPAKSYNPLFIHGGVGLGKTHLLQAICLRILENRPNASLYYISCESFMTQFMEAVQSGEMTNFRHCFRDVDVLVVDDIHFLAKRDRTQEEFFHTFNTLYQASKQIVLSSDAPPGEIPDLEQRLVSRFKWGLVAKVEPPCYDTRVQILKSKARIRGLDLPDDVACYIAERISANIRELEGAITTLQIRASLDARPIDLTLAKSAMGDSAPAHQSAISIHTIIDAVTDFYHVKVTDLQSKRRQRSVAQPRQVCMYLARRLTRLSLEEIGGYFGGRDHTTVMHAVKIVETRREADAEFDGVLDGFESSLKPGSE